MVIEGFAYASGRVGTMPGRRSMQIGWQGERSSRWSGPRKKALDVTSRAGGTLRSSDGREAIDKQEDGTTA